MEYNQNPTPNQNFNPQGQPPENYLVWAILSTVLCCLPLGIVSIIKSTQVNSKWQMGDIAGAQKASADAKKFAMWGAIAAVIVWIIYVILVFVIGLGTTITNINSAY